MRVVYSDETGVGNIDKEPVTVVTAIAINMDSHWIEIEKELYDIQEKTPPGLLENGALKGRLLYSAIRKQIPESSAAEETLKRILQIPIVHGTAIFYGAVDRKGLEVFEQTGVEGFTDPPDFFSSGDTAYDLAFDECMRRVDATARGFTDERLLWIADRSDSQREPATKRTLARYRFVKQGPSPRELKSYQRPGVCLADTVYFGNSAESVALQLADVCCSTVASYLLEKFYGREFCATRFYVGIHRNVVNDGTPILLRERMTTKR